MPAVILLLLVTTSAFAVTSEGFIRKKDASFTLERGLDRSELPTTSGCDEKKLSRYLNHYVKAEWEYNKDRNCFDVISIKRIIYDPLKGTSGRR